MIRLIRKNINTPEEYERIFSVRQKKKEPDPFDVRRWRELLKHYTGGGLIDFGCLDSQIPSMMDLHNPGNWYIGIDHARKVIKERRREFRHKNKSAYFLEQDVYGTIFPDQSFSYAIAGELIEHLEKPKLFVKEAFRVLKKGGTFALSTPFNEARDPGAVDAERHLWSFTYSDINRLLKPYSSKIHITTIGSEYWPKYTYHFSVIIAHATKR